METEHIPTKLYCNCRNWCMTELDAEFDRRHGNLITMETLCDITHIPSTFINIETIETLVVMSLTTLALL